jgi:hypothetical protein
VKRTALLVAGSVAVLAGCGNPVHSHYSVRATAPCLRGLGYHVSTDANKIGLIEASAPEGALRADEPGNTVVITFAHDSSGAQGIESAYRRFAPKKRRAHLDDVMEMQHNVVLLWQVTPPDTELNRVYGCLK